MRALVVDDEGPARRRLSRMLEALGSVEVVAQLEDTSALSEALRTERVDVVFLDVRMPGLDGMSFAQSQRALPPIVFVTAHDEYAARAFGVDAVDYLLKPVRPERLAVAVERLRKRAAGAAPAPTPTSPASQPSAVTAAAVPPSGMSSAAVPSAASAAPSPAPRIVVNTRNLIQLFDARTITRFWSSEKYTLFRAGNAEHMTEESLAALAERLLGFGFLRVHRAELVRSDAVSALRLVDGRYELCLHDGQLARVSRRALPTIKLALGLG